MAYSCTFFISYAGLLLLLLSFSVSVMNGYGPAVLVIAALAVAGLFAMQRYDSNFDLTGEKAARTRYNQNQVLQYLQEEAAKR